MTEVFEVNTINFLNAYILSLNLRLMINEFKFITELKAVEIHLPCKNINELVGKFCGDAHLFNCFRKVRLNYPCNTFLYNFHVPLAYIYLKGIIKSENN